MGVEFLRAYGASADVKELEYMAALHQTSEMRVNGSISSQDVQALLTSRYGLLLSHKECIEIVRSLGGGLSQEELTVQERAYRAGRRLIHKVVDRVNQATTTSSSNREKRSTSESANIPEESSKPVDPESVPEEYLDLVQVVALLLVPTLAKAAKISKESTRNVEEADNKTTDDIHNVQMGRYQKWRRKMRDKKEARKAELAESLLPQPPTLLHDVFRILIRDLDDSDPAEGPVLNVDLVETILLECGEIERASNDILKKEMVEVTRSSSGRLDFEAFVNALTYDLDEWDVGTEERLSTIFFDVFGEERSAVNEKCRKEKGKDPISGGDTELQTEQGMFTGLNSVDHSVVDLVVDTHSSVICVCLIWFFYLMTSITYASIYQSSVSASCLETESDEFGCLLKAQLWNW